MMVSLTVYVCVYFTSQTIVNTLFPGGVNGGIVAGAIISTLLLCVVMAIVVVVLQIVSRRLKKKKQLERMQLDILAL